MGVILTRLGAAELATAVRQGTVSAREVTEAHLDRAATVGEELNAFTSIDAEAALDRADLVDSVRDRGHDPGPLAGVPVALKDLIDQAGVATTAGSSFYRHVADQSATVVRRLESAGAVIVGRAGLHEFAFGFSSENHWFGPVRNPWDPRTSPGGSSGGSAAATAAGLAAIGIGTDTGGSVRVPAALCGLVGLKVTHGRVPLTGVFPLCPSLDTVGPITRSVGDAALVYGVVAGDDPTDPWSAPQPARTPGPPARLNEIRFGVPRPWADAVVTTEVAAAFESALAAIAATGASIADVVIPETGWPDHGAAARSAEIAAVHRAWFTADRDRYGPDVAERLGPVMELTWEEHLRGLEWRAALRHGFDRALADVDVLVTPAVGAMRKEIGAREIEAAGERLHYRSLLARFSAPVNFTGCPALALPLDAPGQPPPSLQIIGPRWSEHRLLEIGLALERAGVSRFLPPPIW